MVGLGVAVARLVPLCGLWQVVMHTGALHVLSTCYELSGNKVVHSAELRVSLQKCVLPNLGKSPNVILPHHQLYNPSFTPENCRDPLSPQYYF